MTAGCGSEDAQQRDAREEVQKHLRTLDGGYVEDDVRCTDAASTWFREVETSEFTCAVRRADGDCDWFEVRVDRTARVVDVQLAERRAGCTLPF
ncbi:MAG TPA: hypothetical protein VM204_02095 [Gaiellaceae bacterium]|nr:hypothetical protein [Gaiellaceae bacterium]